MDVIILTGMSGSGKSKVSDYLEDMGYFCIDNLPPQILPSIVHTFLAGQAREGIAIQRLAFVVDIRSSQYFDGFNAALADLERSGVLYRLVFLDSTDEALLSRYKQTRRMHPLANKNGTLSAIQEERRRLQPLRAQATDIIDTTNFSLVDLRDYIYHLLHSQEDPIEQRMSILVESFGFKYGVPVDADLVLDVRFIPNPYYIPALRVLTGRDPEVVSEVFSHEISRQYVEKQTELLLQILPHYVQEGKVRLTIAVGCTGGRHRSVALTEEIAQRLQNASYRVQILHRDMGNDPRNVTKMADYWPQAASDEEMEGATTVLTEAAPAQESEAVE